MPNMFAIVPAAAYRPVVTDNLPIVVSHPPDAHEQEAPFEVPRTCVRCHASNLQLSSLRVPGVRLPRAALSAADVDRRRHATAVDETGWDGRQSVVHGRLGDDRRARWIG